MAGARVRLCASASDWKWLRQVREPSPAAHRVAGRRWGRDFSLIIDRGWPTLRREAGCARESLPSRGLGTGTKRTWRGSACSTSWQRGLASLAKYWWFPPRRAGAFIVIYPLLI